MKTLTVVATLQARPGKEAELRVVLTGLLAPTHKEAGCIRYDLHVATDNPARFVFLEDWTSRAHLDAHLQTPHLQALVARLDELCVAPPEMSTWERVT